MSARRFFTSIIALLIIMMGFPPHKAEASTRENLVASARAQLGVPYLWGGTTTSGFDCSGFLRYIYRENGITLPRTASEQFQVGTSVTKSDLQVGDLVFFETYKPGPSHSGMYIGNNQFISAKSSRGVAIASINDPYYWGSRYIGAKRVINEEAANQQVLAALAVGEYLDVPESYWARHEIKIMSERGIVSGFGEGKFMPNEHLTRAQAASMIARTLELNVSNTTSVFPDVKSDHWAAAPIYAVQEAGIVKGYEDGTFRPNQVLTREEISMLLVRAFSIAESNGQTTYSDVRADHWAADAIQRITASGITRGFEDNTFRPKEKITRAQFTVFVYRAM
ncbi:S-layer homology domain-containing protein [Anaerobacillus sp. MEB173]|uniref:C40 family peptidase n=1 Tax=Anaerobacillus sp. MEB173 TaxID=3383345 RepID=UPI003F92565F